MYFRQEIDTEHFRNLCYGLNILLSYDRLGKETELEKRLAELEQKKGSVVFNVTPQEMDGLDYVDWRTARIQELLQKAGYTEKETPQADISPAPESVPVIQELPEPQPEQPQPRRLKL
jgi:hypothetical protein